MKLSSWLKHEKPRERLIQKGAEALSNAELMGIILRTGTQDLNAIELGRSLLIHCGSLGDVFNMTAQEFCNIPGLGPAKYAQIKACFELGRRALEEPMQHKPRQQSMVALQKLALSKLNHLRHEAFGCLLFDIHQRFIEFVMISEGTINETAAYPREVIKTLLKYHASAVIIAHNHPSGLIEPSDADQEATLNLSKLLDSMSVTLLDHWIIGHEQVFSFVDRSLL